MNGLQQRLQTDWTPQATVSILTIGQSIFEVMAAAGHTHLGGEDFDNKIADCCTQDSKRKSRGMDLFGNYRATRELHVAFVHASDHRDPLSVREDGCFSFSVRGEV